MKVSLAQSSNANSLVGQVSKELAVQSVILRMTGAPLDAVIRERGSKLHDRQLGNVNVMASVGDDSFDSSRDLCLYVPMFQGRSVEKVRRHQIHFLFLMCLRSLSCAP